MSSLAAFGGASHVLPGSVELLEDALAKAASIEPSGLAEDEAFWTAMRKAFVTSPELIDLDNAALAPTPAPVFSAYVTRAQSLRQAPSEKFVKVWDDLEKVTKPDLAAYIGADPGMIAFTLNATFGLNTVLHGFPLERGDEILVTNHEYPDMIETILQRAKRDGIVMRTVNVPSASENRLELVNRIDRAITPRTRLLLISHVTAWSGEILPVAEVTHAAQRRNVAVLVDAAQSTGILDVNVRKIGCDFLATSLHKWVEAPMGTGALVMQKKWVGKVWPLHPPSWDTTQHPMDLYEWCGTFNMAAYRATSDALKFQRTLGLARKQARVRFLGDYWLERVRRIPGVTVLTPNDRARSFGVASMMFDRIPSEKAVKALRAKGIIVQNKAGRHSPFQNAFRVSPGIYATTLELDRFVSAVKDIAGKTGISSP